MEDFKFLIQKLEKEIEGLAVKPGLKEIGQVLRAADGVVWIEGLPNAKISEILIIEKLDHKILLLTLNLEEGLIGAAALNDFNEIREGDVVVKTNQIIQVPVSEKLIGRVIDPLGRPLDDLGSIETNEFYSLEQEAPNVLQREPVDTPVQTGVKIIDALIPIGRGQRELILGDRQTGKTAIVLDTIINQKQAADERPICIYVAIGQKLSKVAKIYETFKETGALDYTIIVTTSPSDLPILLYLAPYAGCSIGEYFRNKGKAALVVYDDLTKHAWAWREVSLLLRRPAGREAYPGDIFYAHARLLERAAQLKNGGSLTALPICETQLGDISAYIPTNLISITDGQIYLETELFNQGFRPAINIGLSVSRIGSKAQTKLMKKVAGRLKLDLAQYRELETFAQVSTELAEETKKKLIRGRRLTELLKQENLKPLSFEKTAILIYAAINGYLDEWPLARIKEFETRLLEQIEFEAKDILEQLQDQKDLDEKLEGRLKKYLSQFFVNFNANVRE